MSSLIVFLRALVAFFRAARASGHSTRAAIDVACTRCAELLDEEAAAVAAGQRPWFGVHHEEAPDA